MAKRNTTTAPVTTAAVHPLQVVVGLGNKPYNVRATTAADNAASWQLVCAFLSTNGGTATVGQIQQHLQSSRNHASFASYIVKRGYLAPVAAPAPSAQVAVTA